MSSVSELAEQLLKTYEYNLQNFTTFRNGISAIETFDQFQSLRNKLIQALLDYENDYRQMANSLHSLFKYNNTLKTSIDNMSTNVYFPQTQLKRNYEEVCATNNKLIFDISRLKSTILSKDSMIRELQEHLANAEGKLINIEKGFQFAKEQNDLINDKLDNLKTSSTQSPIRKSITSRVTDATLKIFADPNNTDVFLNKYGKNLHEKLITNTPDVKLLEQVEDDLGIRVIKTELCHSPRKTPRKSLSGCGPYRSYSNSERKSFPTVQKIPSFKNLRLNADRFDYNTRVYFNDWNYWDSAKDFFRNYKS
jgi:hypothetical protein